MDPIQSSVELGPVSSIENRGSPSFISRSAFPAGARNGSNAKAQARLADLPVRRAARGGGRRRDHWR